MNLCMDGALFFRRNAQAVERRWPELLQGRHKTRLAPATDQLIAELARHLGAHAAAAHSAPVGSACVAEP
ncbi:hypothetical protein CBM2634_A100329 [Cupriavidus taiwanensis]|uniref:Uncharacterized protein n=1 Tax=Cupriavidus taiwanensis TaxID=164546 RepID=A0A375IWI1_9BURK|nr:hypothetical protein CBM2634_A100329 [Cupriavidus taiwanensis]